MVGLDIDEEIRAGVWRRFDGGGREGGFVVFSTRRFRVVELIFSRDASFDSEILLYDSPNLTRKNGEVHHLLSLLEFWTFLGARAQQQLLVDANVEQCRLESTRRN